MPTITTGTATAAFNPGEDKPPVEFCCRFVFVLLAALEAVETAELPLLEAPDEPDRDPVLTATTDPEVVTCDVIELETSDDVWEDAAFGGIVDVANVVETTPVLVP